MTNRKTPNKKRLVGSAKKDVMRSVPQRFKWTDGFPAIAFYSPNGWHVLFFGNVYGPFTKRRAINAAKRMAVESAIG